MDEYEELEDMPDLPGTSVDILRLAGLVDRTSSGRFFAGKTAPDGEHGVNLVHLEDVIGAITLLLQAPKGGHIYNICAPAHPARNVFYPQMARFWGWSLRSSEIVWTAAKVRLLMAVGFVMNWDLNTNIPIRW